ncbi:MAG: flagellar biosynthesis protein FlhF [Rhodocyclaceae bacterium]|jgi:flagellar biosynthesis protein FlhF|nr:flagellar biosynthesis protein FlhF [Rhodocyclaceae bacterium]
MNVKRYFAKTAREALRALKEELGADAIVLSNRAVEGGVEILALPADGVAALQAPARPAPAAPAAIPPRVREVLPEEHSFGDEADDFRVSLSAAARRPVPGAPAAPATIRPFDPPRVELPRSRTGGSPYAPLPATRRPEVQPAQASMGAAESRQPLVVEAVPAPAPTAGPGEARMEALEAANSQLMAELVGIRGLLERQLAGFAWGETRRQAPTQAQVLGEMLEAGFSATLARELAAEIPEEAPPADARTAVKNALNRRLPARATDADIIDRGGVYALVGPTGVGKTTTTAKLAARCVVRHGAEKLALITTDGYRIGAHEQLKIYGRILGVPVFTVRDAADLRQTLAELKGKHMVLIDTVGMSQRDKLVAEQAAMLMGAGGVRRLLLLNATCRGDTLDDVIRAYDGPDLAGCIFTKVDEAASLAPVVDAAVRRRLEIFYVANGQRVPEDLHLPNRPYLVHRSLREAAADSPHRLAADEAGLILAGAGLGA